MVLYLSAVSRENTKQNKTNLSGTKINMLALNAFERGVMSKA